MPFLQNFCAIHAISSTSFSVGPLWFSALLIYFLTFYHVWRPGAHACHNAYSYTYTLINYAQSYLASFPVSTPQLTCQKKEKKLGSGDWERGYTYLPFSRPRHTITSYPGLPPRLYLAAVENSWLVSSGAHEPPSFAVLISSWFL